VFLPRGTWHTTRAESDSMSLSIGIRPPPALDHLLHQLRGLLLQDGRWRRPLYGALREDSRRAVELRRLDALLAELPVAVARLSAADLAPGSDTRVAVDRPARFQKVPMSAIRFAVMDDRLQLTVTAWDADWIERTTLQSDVPRPLESALQWLRGKEAAFDSAQLRDAFPPILAPDLGQLLDLLAEAGYLRRLWFPTL
jgi:hypothetical protein